MACNGLAEECLERYALLSLIKAPTAMPKDGHGCAPFTVAVRNGHKKDSHNTAHTPNTRNAPECGSRWKRSIEMKTAYSMLKIVSKQEAFHLEGFLFVVSYFY